MFEPMINLKNQRVKNGLTMQQLGKKVGVNLHTIYQYESGRRSPTIQQLKKLAEALECTVNDII